MHKIIGTENPDSFASKENRYQLSKTDQTKKTQNKSSNRADNQPLKYDYRMLQNYLKGEVGVQINALMAGTAWNLEKFMETVKEKLLWLLFRYRIYPQKKLETKVVDVNMD
jgi:hypothetical protein